MSTWWKLHKVSQLCTSLKKRWHRDNYCYVSQSREWWAIHQYFNDLASMGVNRVESWLWITCLCSAWHPEWCCVFRELNEKLQADSCPVRLKLTTMTTKDVIMPSERVSGLKVRGYSSSVVFNLPPAYTKDSIPVNRTHIPTCGTALEASLYNSGQNSTSAGLWGCFSDRLQLSKGFGTKSRLF